MKCQMFSFMLTVILNMVAGAVYTNIQKETCCKGVLHPGIKKACCGNQTFTIGVDECCYDGQGGAVLVPQRKNASDPFYLCCQGVVHIVPSLTDYKCCVSLLYKPTERICCAANVHGDQRTLPILPGHENDDQCCGNSTYSSAQGLTCCAGTIVKSETQICCNKENPPVFKPKPSTQCCGEDLFDSTVQQCGSTGVIPIGQNTDFNSLISKCGSDNKREGSNFHETETRDICCNNKVHVVPVKSEIYCCDKELYDRRFQVCCQFNNQSKVLNVAEHLDIDCCGSDMTPYNRALSQCCYGNVEARDPILEKDPNMRMCCV